MAQGREYSKYQKKIINRYYEHLDTIQLTKLGETVTELYLADSPKKAEKLWKTAATALARIDDASGRVAKIIEEKNVEGLAKLVGELAAKK
jgi:hypothetical protein